MGLTISGSNTVHAKMGRSLFTSIIVITKQADYTSITLYLLAASASQRINNRYENRNHNLKRSN